jgi:Dolichyl-phosphate-mannose-protein mannosyltransferase
VALELRAIALVKPVPPNFTIVLTIALLGMGTLYVTRIVDLFPLQHDVSSENSFGDDWFAYNRYALSILNDGLTMPVVTEAYFRPAGFGYPYFIAVVYAIAGIRSEAVYLVQAALLVGGIAGMYALFRAHVSRRAALLFLVALSGIIYADVYRTLTFRLLSENLLFPVWPALLYFVLNGESKGKYGYFAAAGIASGIGFLMRPNLILVAPAAAAAVFVASTRASAWRARAAAILLTTCMLVSSLMPLRNYAVTGEPSIAAVTGASDWWVAGHIDRVDLTVPQRAARIVRSIAMRSAYVVGIPYFLQPTFRIRPHWLIVWACFFWYLRTLPRRTHQFSEVLVLALAVAYFTPIFTLGYVSNYGVRNLAPGLPLVLWLAIRGLDLSVFNRVPSLMPFGVSAASKQRSPA